MPVQSQQLPLWEKVLKCFIIIKLHNTLRVNYLYGRRSQPQRLHVWNVRMSAFIDLIMLRLVCPFSRSWFYNQIISVSSVFDKLKLKRTNKQISFSTAASSVAVRHFKVRSSSAPWSRAAAYRAGVPSGALIHAFCQTTFSLIFIKIFLTEIFKAINSVLHDCSCWIIVC